MDLFIVNEHGKKMNTGTYSIHYEHIKLILIKFKPFQYFCLQSLISKGKQNNIKPIEITHDEI